MRLDYIIVQAGGKGSRMQNLTANKPKALVPVNNLPMIFHLFRKYPDKKYVIIGDYKYDVLERYLSAFADVDYKLVRASGNQGTCAGLSKALSLIPDDERFMLIWCDLILSDDYEIPDTDNNTVGISKDFKCRWMYKDGRFSEEPSAEHGVAGHFVFKEKSVIADVPNNGEFVRWLQEKNIQFEEQPLYKTREYGLYSEWEKLPKMRCRPFNRITVNGDRIIKEGIDDQGRKLAIREVAWYKKLQGKSFDAIPRIFSYSPLEMEFIDGGCVYEYPQLHEEQKKAILKGIVKCLKYIHNTESILRDKESYKEAYLNKTYERLEKVRNLVPFANNSTIVINGINCKNIFFCKDEVEKLVMQYMPDEFVLIHGDCTFSNTMLRNGKEPVLIDPRGYFGNTELFGDAAYDWAKLYYSLYSNYDQFNLKRFMLEINEKGVNIEMASNEWETLEDYFFELLGSEVTRKQMKLFLAIIWLSLTTYAWEDYDSICGAFYNGSLYLKEALDYE